jgi:nitrogen fixation/metabolism regulation signal transduction histidine kinase
VTSRDELGVLTESFNSMTRQLEEARRGVESNRMALEAAKARLENILANLSAGVLVFDHELALSISNHGAAAILGNELEGFAAQMRAHFAAQGDADWQLEIQLKGTGKTLHARGARLPQATGGGAVVVFDDLTRLIQAQRATAWAEVARRLAHEIKSPLTPIQLAVQQCVSSYKGDDAKFKKLLVDTGEIVEEEIAALRRLVDTFRTLGALPKVEASPIALADVIEELKLDPTNAARLTLQPPAQAVTVRADKLLLKRVLANLVENAIHAGQENGNPGDVVVGWRTDGDVARITVDDHGKGVPAETREKIFEPYVTTKTTGTGLGLAIARKIAIEHGGELAVSPDPAPTGGARFVVTLPLRSPGASLA